MAKAYANVPLIDGGNVLIKISTIQLVKHDHLTKGVNQCCICTTNKVCGFFRAALSIKEVEELLG